MTDSITGIDDEAKVISDIATALRPLSKDARIRVLHYMGVRFGYGSGSGKGHIGSHGERILSVLRDEHRPMRAGEVAELAQIDKRSVATRLSDLKKKGLAVRSSNGWELPMGGRKSCASTRSTSSAASSPRARNRTSASK